MEDSWTVVSKKSRSGIKNDSDTGAAPLKFSSLNNIYSNPPRLHQSDGGGYNPRNNYPRNTVGGGHSPTGSSSSGIRGTSTPTPYRGGVTPRGRGGNSTGGGTGYRGGNNKRFNKMNEAQLGYLNNEEKERFLKLKEEIPHIMMPDHIRNIQQKLNIDELANRMLSVEWVEYQREGWVYDRVIKPDDPNSIPEDDGNEYDIKELGTKWGDIVLFKRVM